MYLHAIEILMVSIHTGKLVVNKFYDFLGKQSGLTRSFYRQGSWDFSSGFRNSMGENYITKNYTINVINDLSPAVHIVGEYQ